jgi:hypothetical protein
MSLPMSVQEYCPSQYGGTLNTSTHMCVGGVGPPPTCTAGVTGTGTWKVAGPGAGGSDPAIRPPINGGSNGQCEINITNVRRCYQGVDGASYCTYDWTQTGNVKAAGAPGTSGGGPSSPPPAEKQRAPVPPTSGNPQTGSCPGGTVQAGFDSSGTPICIGQGSDPQNPPAPPKTSSSPPTTTNNGDGSSDTVTRNTQTNSDGSTTTTTVTKHTAPDGTVSTSVDVATNNATAGTPGKTDSNPDDAKYDLCKQHPDLSMCRNSTVAGTCGEITCTGDAIQCATLRAAAAMQCQQKKDMDDLAASPSKALGDSILSGADPQKAAIDGAIKGTDIDLSKPTLDQGGFVGAACLSSKSFDVMGRSVTVDFTRVCSDIQPLRTVVMACAFILAYLIVSRSVLQS